MGVTPPPSATVATVVPAVMVAQVWGTSTPVQAAPAVTVAATGSPVAAATTPPADTGAEAGSSTYRNTAVPGPDGFDTVAPLARTGRVPPYALADVVATFVGGFKRSHGAFKFSELALRDQGTHYGFLEHGTLFSKLRATVSAARAMAQPIAIQAHQRSFRSGEKRRQHQQHDQ